MRHKEFKKQTDYSKNDVFDDSDWNDVEEVLKIWMLNKHSDIRVDLHLNFKTILPVIEVDGNKTSSHENANIHTSIGGVSLIDYKTDF